MQLIGDWLAPFRRFWLVAVTVYSPVYMLNFGATGPLLWALIGANHLALIVLGFGMHRLVPAVVNWGLRHQKFNIVLRAKLQNAEVRRARCRAYADTFVVLVASAVFALTPLVSGVTRAWLSYSVVAVLVALVVAIICSFRKEAIDAA